ncbi:hypothetical protein AB4371_19950 [Vibrio sp. 10N.261.51.A3]|uniref:hypothetical protein n=1 Tax=unclassified Vibrio TaxID=2614977 RepID=UPI0010BD9D39|nr:hypothetical protein [Vibrio sp. F13]TKF88503.1 hypothetical protein FCV73_18570 [Vibrio sp. F13]
MTPLEHYINTTVFPPYFLIEVCEEGYQASYSYDVKFIQTIEQLEMFLQVAADAFADLLNGLCKEYDLTVIEVYGGSWKILENIRDKETQQPQVCIAKVSHFEEIEMLANDLLLDSFFPNDDNYLEKHR